VTAPDGAVSLTPVGDYLRARAPGPASVTHWGANESDPGCCAGAHPACTYAAGQREAFRSLAAAFAECAADSGGSPVVARVYRAAAETAARCAESGGYRPAQDAPGRLPEPRSGPEGPSRLSPDPAGRPEASQGRAGGAA
jgi:hypothetical protein